MHKKHNCVVLCPWLGALPEKSQIKHSKCADSTLCVVSAQNGGHIWEMVPKDRGFQFSSHGVNWILIHNPESGKQHYLFPDSVVLQILCYEQESNILGRVGFTEKL